MGLKYITAGESHGKGILAVLESVPAGLDLDLAQINGQLRLRQGGYGRGGRQAIETDTVEILTGVQGTRTLGSPLSLWVCNRDFRLPELPDLEFPRPGHGDLAGCMKYRNGMRSILERASARETAGKVAAGAVAMQILKAVGISVIGYVSQIGSVKLNPDKEIVGAVVCGSVRDRELVERIRHRRDMSPVYSISDPESDQQACWLIDQTRADGDTVGGIIDVRVTGVPFGLGTHVQSNQRLDGRLAQAVMGVQAIKGVEIGMGFDTAKLPGSMVHDPILFDAQRESEPCHGFVHSSNHAGGIEAGMSNAEDILVRAAMKPIPTLKKGLPSVDLQTHEPTQASYERSDVCAVPAAAIVVESVVAMEIATAVTEKFGCDSMEELVARFG